MAKYFLSDFQLNRTERGNGGKGRTFIFFQFLAQVALDIAKKAATVQREREITLIFRVRGLFMQGWYK
jgi:hypothetical protein